MAILHRTALNNELKVVVSRHLEEINEYISPSASLQLEIPQFIVADFERLSEICEYPTYNASYELYEEARNCQAELETFLRRMNQEVDSTFAETHIGQIWLQIGTWCQEVGQHFQLTTNDVWDMIAPVRPDHLEALGNGVFEAKWWKQVPMMDIKLLQCTEGINVHVQPFEPAQLPGGLAVRFTITANPQFTRSEGR